MTGHSRSKNGVASLAHLLHYVLVIPTNEARCSTHRDGQNKSGHDVEEEDVLKSGYVFTSSPNLTRVFIS